MSKLARMNKRRVITVLALAAIVVAGIATMLLCPGEPVFQGKPLSHWVEELRVSWQGPGSAKAEAAIRAIGTNALPYLVSALKAKDSRLKLELVQLCGRQNLIKFPFRFADETRDNALRTFISLGPTASGAIPDLAAMLKEADLTFYAGVALFAIGTNSIPVLTEACGQTNAIVRKQAAFVLSRLTKRRGGDPTRGYPAIPIGAAGSTNMVSRLTLSVEDEDIAGLSANLSSPVAAVRRASAEALFWL